MPPPFDSAPTHYLFSGRTAIYQGVRLLEVSAGESVLVPAFNCAAVIEPILRHGARVSFYRINTDCSPDFDDIERRTDSTTRAILAIHYFGFPQPLERFRAFCSKRGLYLIEDCAHVLAGQSESRPLGSTGDISIFSWRKFLPIPDGGQLVVNNPRLTLDVRFDKPSMMLRMKAVKDVVDRMLDHSRTPLARAIARVSRFSSNARRLLPSKLTPGTRPAVAARSIDAFDLGFPFTMVNLPMSMPSRFILHRIDLRQVIEQRRLNYLYVRKILGSLPGVTPLFSDLPEGVCPLAFPFFVEGRRDFHLVLRSKGIPASTWGDVIHPHLPLDDFPEARTLYERLMYVPVHQGLSIDEMDVMGRVMREALCTTA